MITFPKRTKYQKSIFHDLSLASASPSSYQIITITIITPPDPLQNSSGSVCMQRGRREASERKPTDASQPVSVTYIDIVIYIVIYTYFVVYIDKLAMSVISKVDGGATVVNILWETQF